MARTARKTLATEETASQEPVTPLEAPEPQVSATALADALVQAINMTKPVERKTMFSRTAKTPWTPKDGSPRVILKRPIFQHGNPVTSSNATNEDLELCNQLKPGSYCDGYVQVRKTSSGGLNIEYKIRTSAQKVKLSDRYGISNFTQLLARLVDEGKNPKAYKAHDDF